MIVRIVPTPRQILEQQITSLRGEQRKAEMWGRGDYGELQNAQKVLRDQFEDALSDMQALKQRMAADPRPEPPSSDQKEEPMLFVMHGGRIIEEAAPTGKIALVFSDVMGSTALWEQEPQAMSEALKLHNSIVVSLGV